MYSDMNMDYVAKIARYGSSYILYLPKGLCDHEGWKVGDIVRVKLSLMEHGPEIHTFTIDGRPFSITKPNVLKACKKGEIPLYYYENKRVKYCIMIESVRYPIKWVLSETLNLDPIFFTSNYAKRILGKLGFEIRNDWHKEKYNQ